MENIISITMVIAGTVWIGLLMTALVGKALGSIIPALRRGQKKWSNKGVEAEALVLGTEQIGDPVHKQLKLKIQLQVRPSKGRNFVVEIKEVLLGEDIASLKTGNIVWVKYNPANTRELFLLKK